MARPNKNSAEYFSHDCDMRNDIKVKALRRKFGNEGYAIWCFTLEVLTDSENFFADYSDLSKELMAADFDISLDRMQEIIDFCLRVNLLQLTEDNRLYSQAHQKRLQGVIELREKRARAGKAGMASRWNNKSYQTDNNVITTDNKGKESKVNESKVNQSKEKNNIVYPYQDISRLWNEICGNALPKVKGLSDNRRSKIKSRLSECGAKTSEEMIAWAQDLFQRVAASAFLCGANNHQWIATFDWIFENPTNWVKVSEGNYDNKRGLNTGFTGVENSLGIGEYITQDGRRTYGSGRANIPMSAPPRPSEKYQWSAESQNWIML